MMEAKLRKEALAHSGACEQCATRLADERALTFGLRALATEAKSVSAPDRVELKLLAALRQRESAKRYSRSHRLRYMAAAAAAVIMIVSGLALMHEQGLENQRRW